MSICGKREYQPLKKWKLCILALSGLPFVVKFAYLNQAWVSSPIDRAQLGLWGTGVLLIVVVTAILKLIFHFPTNKPLRQSRALRTLPLPIVIYILGTVYNINAVQLIASVGIAWMTAWMLYGRIAGSMLAIAAVMATLAVPGSSYWLGKASTAFSAPIRAAYTPEFTARSQSGYLGRKAVPSEAFSRFFRTSDAHQFRYASPSNDVSVLAVRIGSNIHEIHPATHCLRSSGWLVQSEQLHDVALNGRADSLSVTESVVANSAGAKLLVWVWYSSPEKSTGSFIRFRRMYKKNAVWRTYQLTSPIGNGNDIAEVRQNLISFLESGKISK